MNSDLKIYSLTPNPALDLSGFVKEILPNEKNYVTKSRYDPGGNGINASRILGRLGVKTQVMGFIGGPTGKQLKKLLQNENVTCRFVEIQNDTRLNVTVTQEKKHQQTRLTFPGPQVSRNEVRKLLDQVSLLKGPGVFIIGGSLTAGFPMKTVLQIAKGVSRKGLGVILDLPAQEMKTALGRSNQADGMKYLLVKPNRLELENLLGVKLGNDLKKIRAGAAQLSKKSALVCISLGSQGALLVEGKRSWLAHPPQIKARGSVGAGDSMVGAMVAQLARFNLNCSESISQASDGQLEEVLRWGVAAGAATAMTLGTSLGEAKVIQGLAARVEVEVSV